MSTSSSLRQAVPDKYPADTENSRLRKKLSWTRSEAWNLQRMEKNSFRTPVDLRRRYREKEKSASAGPACEQHCFLSDAGCIEKEMMSAQDTCSIETRRSSDIYGYVENGSVDVALVSDLFKFQKNSSVPVFGGSCCRWFPPDAMQRIRWNFWNTF